MPAKDEFAPPPHSRESPVPRRHDGTDGRQRGRNPVRVGGLLVWWTQGRPAVQANPGLWGAIPLGLGERERRVAWSAKERKA
jgi:hypothetical protein